MVNQFDQLQNIEIAGDDKHNERVKKFLLVNINFLWSFYEYHRKNHRFNQP